MGKFKVSFYGFAYIEADDIDEAIEKFSDDLTLYSECEIVTIMEVDDFMVSFE